MPLKSLLDNFSERAGIGIRAGVVPCYPTVVCGEAAVNGLGKNRYAIGGHVDVVLNTLQHPPRRVA